ncbi:hypothetical protein GCM10009765_59980 [Fodinicola feengrottensis]|uniref:Uncharacterized protein n=1 Tax=Fodinicola feengrottensis TaxID=435914 RepID=A0ABP4UCL0_9ACTN
MVGWQFAPECDCAVSDEYWLLDIRQGYDGRNTIALKPTRHRYFFCSCRASARPRDTRDDTAGEPVNCIVSNAYWLGAVGGDVEFFGGSKHCVKVIRGGHLSMGSSIH